MIDSRIEAGIHEDIERIEAILHTKIFDESNDSHPLRQSAFIELVICLSDLLQKSEDVGVPVLFADNIDITSEIKNVTDLARRIRNAACHISSPTHRISNTEMFFAFNTTRGKVAIFAIGDKALESEFDDDTCFFYGDMRIYLNRHIIRAYIEAKQNLTPLVNRPL